jgi:F0F1-type ATP synthase assembly protein I
MLPVPILDSALIVLSVLLGIQLQRFFDAKPWAITKTLRARIFYAVTAITLALLIVLVTLLKM